MKTFAKNLMTALCLLLGNVMIAQADNVKVSVDDFSIGVGQTYTVAVNLDNDVDIVGMNFDVTLPTGLEMVNTEAKTMFAKGDRLTRNHSVLGSNPSTGVYRMLLSSTSKTPVIGNSGTMVTFDVKATKELAKNSYINFNNVTCADADNNKTVTNFSVRVTRQAVLDGEVGFYGVTEEVNISPKAEQTVTVEVGIRSNATIVGMQCDVTLPAGMTLVESKDGFFGYTDLIPDEASFSTNVDGQTYRAALSSLTNEVFGKSESGSTFFTFEVKADATLAKDAEIKVGNFVVSNASADGFELPDVVTIAVKNADVYADEAAAAANDAAYEKLTAELDALQEKLDAAKKTVEEDDADVAADFAETIAAIQAQIDALRTQLDADHEAGNLNEESTVDTEEIETAIEKLLADAAAAEEAYKAEQAEKAKKEANDAAFDRLTKQLDDLQAQFDAAKKTVEEDDADVAADFAETIAAIQAQIDALRTQLAADHEAVALTADSTVDTEEVETAIEKLLADAAAAEEAYKAEQAEKAKKEANDAVFDRLTKQLDDLQAQFDAAKTTVEEDDADVAADFTETIAAIQDQIDALRTQLAADHEAVALTADSTVDTEEVEAAIEKLLADAATAEEAFKADKAKKEANDAAFDRLTKQIDAVQAKLDAAKLTIATSCPNVADDFAEAIAALQERINDLRTQIAADHEAVALTADSTIDTQAIEDDIMKVAVEAGKAQKEYEAKVAANNEAYKRLNEQLSDLQRMLDDAKATIAEKYYDVDVTDDVNSIQALIDAAREEVADAYAEVALTADSTIDYDAIKKAIDDMLAKAEQLTGIALASADGSAPIYYSLQGVRVDHPVRGEVYLVRKMIDGKVKFVKTICSVSL